MENFHNNKLPKETSQCICLSVILIDSVFRIGKNHYLQVFLEECKMLLEKKRCPNISSDDSDREDSDKENSSEENSDEETFNEKN